MAKVTNAPTTIGERIKLLREKKGETQEELREELHLAKRETIAQWENNTRDIKTNYTILLAKHFNVSCDYLLRGIEQKNVELNQLTHLSNEALDNLVNGLNMCWYDADTITTEPGLHAYDLINYMLKDRELVSNITHELIEAYIDYEDWKFEQYTQEDESNRYKMSFQKSDEKRQFDFRIWEIEQAFKHLVISSIEKMFLDRN